MIIIQSPDKAIDGVILSAILIYNKTNRTTQRLYTFIVPLLAVISVHMVNMNCLQLIASKI